MLVPRSLKILIILPSGNLQIEKGEILSFVKMMSQYEFLNPNCIILHKLFSTHYNQCKIYNSRIVNKNHYFIRNFPEKDIMDKTVLACKYETLQRSSNIKVT